MKKLGIRRIAAEADHRFGTSAPEEVLRERKHSLTESEKRFVQRKRLTWGTDCPPTRTVSDCAGVVRNERDFVG